MTGQAGTKCTHGKSKHFIQSVVGFVHVLLRDEDTLIPWSSTTLPETVFKSNTLMIRISIQ